MMMEENLDTAVGPKIRQWAQRYSNGPKDWATDSTSTRQKLHMVDLNVNRKEEG